MQFLDHEWIPTDLDDHVDGNWNGDGDSMFAEVEDSAFDGDDVDVAGSVPVGATAAIRHVERFVRKTLPYVTTPAPTTWTMLLFAEVLSPSMESRRGHRSRRRGDVEQDQYAVLATVPNRTWSASTRTTRSRAGGRAPCTRRARWCGTRSRGYNVTVHVGHGSAT